MSLRLRLIVAFFLFSVVPLGAVTFYSYASNVRALQQAAQHETEMLTTELTQRMQVVTAQISDRVQQLMDIPAASTAATGTTGTSSGHGEATSGRTMVARSTEKSSHTSKRASAAMTPAPAAPAAPAAT